MAGDRTGLWKKALLLLASALAVAACACGDPERAGALPSATPTSSSPNPTASPVVSALQPTPSATYAPQLEPDQTPAPALTPVPGPGPTPVVSDDLVDPPERDLFEIARRLRPAGTGPTSRVLATAAPEVSEGHRETFSVINQSTGELRDAGAVLMVVSENAYWYVDENMNIPTDLLRTAAAQFESNILPLLMKEFGTVWTPGVDGDPRITMLHTDLGPGIAGYYSSHDEYTRPVYEHSNQREMLYLDANKIKPGTADYLGLIAHELQHAVHWNYDRGEDSWVNEGLSELAKSLAGYPTSFDSIFLGNTATQLDAWAGGFGAAGANYGASTMFMLYLREHFGRADGLKALAQQPMDGSNGVDAYLAPAGLKFEDVFTDWVVANYLDAPEGKYSYAARNVQVDGVVTIGALGERTGSLPQFSAGYFNLDLTGDVVIEFRGETATRRFPSDCRSGERCWWGNRGDSVDTTLTRELDLTKVASATLEFWGWWDIEKDWDYAYVEVSTDGKTWTILRGPRTTNENPIGNSFGPGYTGSTGEWVQERVDLSAYAGKKVLVRFEYISDDSIYGDGLVIDDISVPEIGFHDDSEKDAGWAANGFLRTDNTLDQSYIVQVIKEMSTGGYEVVQLPLDKTNSGKVQISGLGSNVTGAVVVISPSTRGTTQPANWSLTVSAGQ